MFFSSGNVIPFRLDAFAKHNILIAAKNHPELLDKAIWRRFNTVIEISLPQNDDIFSLIKVFTDGFNVDFIEDEKNFKNRQNN